MKPATINDSTAALVLFIFVILTGIALHFAWPQNAITARAKQQRSLAAQLCGNNQVLRLRKAEGGVAILCTDPKSGVVRLPNKQEITERQPAGA